ncbi:beta-defensin 39 precursor [Rattus norvegicus]|uniref:Beta-defensin 39 n=2 Tax=Rattus norvegicus TaxID=10116 RepID=DFB39_RAT|nr:beta-defensin 39 precursor [Rattus norvegicus]Q32ZF7.1 RecName: Full=Beta-defensin 39; Short=BD-39; AltName: Full=Defensin, beta 39; Flags: Precursor [Rattus norvegicus]AAT51905.1 beta-defensin 39 [Rattus norvegicus]|eukprot:NP_001032611.1 beta-defensin 39 precursor [Rattus norvegicus]
MKISCFLLLVLSLSCFQINSVSGIDSVKCFQKNNTCHTIRCPYFQDEVGTCYEGRGKCCQKRLLSIRVPKKKV